MTDTIKKIRKLLIANRGEIACRVIATCQNLGIKTVAVHSDVDKKAMHVAMADEAVNLGPAAASESYLVIDKIIGAAKATGADAIHPGYGFLSENPTFANACADEGIIFVGPSAASMNAMALKGAAKKLMTDAGVPVVPGYHGDDQSLETLTAEAEKIGYPVLIKAVAGGGGKGMRAANNSSEIAAAIEAAKREGKNSFANDKLLIEKLITKPRHIELQVFGDKDGNAVHLFERDCSLQRRHQKVVEEAPAPGMGTEMRRAMGEAAVRAAEAINYSGAGTVEFIVDVTNGLDNAPFYFMEMNTRLQVEHPVTEMITGQDLVEWQLSVAEGHALPLSQDEIDVLTHGHAVEVRLYAEDPFNDFMPSIGTIGLFNPFADLPANTRIDTGVSAGDEVSIHYDPMIGKLIAWGDTRDDAINALIGLMEATPISGVTTNRDFLLRALRHPEFQAGDVHTGFIPAFADSLLKRPEAGRNDYALAAIAVWASRQVEPQAGIADPWAINDGFRLNLPNGEQINFVSAEGEQIAVNLENQDSLIRAAINEHVWELSDIVLREGQLSYVRDGLRHQCFAEVSEHTVTLVNKDTTLSLTRVTLDSTSSDDADGPGTIVAPMPGKILELKTSIGAVVKRGDPLLVMEAMKMEQTITAPRDGIVTELTPSAGDQVADGTVLIVIGDE
ncbi:acetyl/propionyl/methylcrotonyl-CoA carboxylase subunit alpha [Kordiimonas aquimaris]|uniref:acetyl/propionyl/methylcrotonyl-CoA carboxylase subunit alpha n=1 Tax=Kordiimonas aquimaris TaxID=707591 RepID=UPI0021CEB815|nr:acetyl/propionyl/methylcrotonyl-CoA carboxylase subunit alpha [Kordiimonas aquimaris]